MSAELHVLEPWLDKPGICERFELAPDVAENLIAGGMPHAVFRFEAETDNRRFKVSEVEPWLRRRRTRGARCDPEPARTARPEDVVPCCLYRIYDEAGALLYVGMTKQRLRRFSQHGATQRWWREVARIDVKHFDNREECAIAERRAIRDEDPRYNLR